MLRFAVFFLFISIYLFSVGIPFYSSDGQVMYETARAIALEGQLDIPPSPLPQTAIGQDGKTFSKYDPGMPLMAAPLVAWADNIAKEAIANRYAVAAVWVMLLPALSMAMAITALFTIAQRTYGMRRALLIVIGAGLGTSVWPYSRLFFAEAVLTGLLTLCMMLLTTKRPLTLLASLVMGLAITTRLSMIIYIPALVFLVHRTSHRRGLLQFLIGPALAIAVLLYHNYYRFGEPFTTGYEGETFSQLPWVGAFGLLFSPGKSVFIYAPPLILSVWLFARFRRRLPLVATTILLMTGTALIYYGTWWAWHGGWVWGPRFLVPLMPLWCLAWGELPSGFKWRLVATTIFYLGVGVQIVGTFTNVNHTYADAFEGSSDPDDESRYAVVHYDIDKTPLAAGFKLASAGEWEKHAIYQLHTTDLTADWVERVPRDIHRVFGFSLIVIAWALVQRKTPTMAERPQFNYGGQAVMEGVMMRGAHMAAIAVRDPEGNIVIHEERLNHTIYQGPISKIPFLRGLIGLWDALVLGTRALIWSANIALQEELEDNKNAASASNAEKQDDRKYQDVFTDTAIFGVVALSLTLGIGLFFALPAALSTWIGDLIGTDSRLMKDTIEGVVKLTIFIGYIALIGLMPDVKRLFGYHGAEHKTINAYEAGAPLVPEEVQKHSIEHPRCGTAFLLIVIMVSIVAHAITGRPDNFFLLILSRVVAIPLVAGMAYEILKFTAKNLDNPIIRTIIIPNLALQHLTTRQPDETMIEVGIAALERVLAAEEAVAKGQTYEPQPEIIIYGTPAPESGD